MTGLLTRWLVIFTAVQKTQLPFLVLSPRDGRSQEGTGSTRLRLRAAEEAPCIAQQHTPPAPGKVGVGQLDMERSLSLLVKVNRMRGGIQEDAKWADGILRHVEGTVSAVGFSSVADHSLCFCIQASCGSFPYTSLLLWNYPDSTKSSAMALNLLSTSFSLLLQTGNQLTGNRELCILKPLIDKYFEGVQNMFILFLIICLMKETNKVQRGATACSLKHIKMSYVQ